MKNIDVEANDRSLKMYKLFQEIDREMPIGQVQFFLQAATSQGLCISDIARATKIKLSSASRYVGALSARKRQGVPGLGFLHAYTSSHHATQKLAVLTPKGEEFLERLARET